MNNIVKVVDYIMLSKKILVVEDESIIGIDIAAKLEKSGYRVVGLAVDDIQALDCVSVDVPDLILMDISLKSAVDGIELTKTIHEQHPIPVIYLTSYSDSETIQRSMETRPYGYIIKPFTTQTLLTTIQLAFIRVELENCLIENSELLQNILDSTLDGIAVIDEHKNIIKYNSAFCRILGNDTFVDSECIDALLGNFHIDDKTHSMLSIETPNGTKRLLASLCSFSGGYIMTVTDITEIETFKIALNNAENRFSTLFKKKLIPAVLATFPDSTVYDANEKFLALYGADEDIYGKPLSTFLGQDVITRIISSVDESGAFCVSRIPQQRLDGTDFYADFRGNRIFIDDNVYFLIDIEDVSEKIKMENMEKELKLQMIQNNKMTALGTLVSGVAHELNNPNNFIMFNTSLLNDYLSDMFNILDNVAKENPDLKIGNISYEEAKGDTMQLLNGTIKGSERIRDIVHDLKGFARQDIPLCKERVKIDKPLHAAVRILKHKINKSTDNFILHTAENLPDIMGNSQKLEQVFINLIVNSLEALTSKGQSVRITCHHSDDSVVVEIEDEGTGIPDDVLQRITEPFFTTKQSSGGTGLGLSIAYSIIQDHCGNISFSSKLNKGTLVRISVPAALLS